MSMFFAMCVTISCVIIAVLLFLTSSVNNDLFLSYFRWSWLFYAVSFAYVMCYIQFMPFLPLIVKSILDMLSVWFVLRAVYALQRITSTDIWFRSMVICLLWVSIAFYLGLNPALTAAPIAIFDLGATFVICVSIIKESDMSKITKIIAAILFTIYGLFKAFFAISPSLYSDLNNSFTMEFLYMIMFSLFVCLFYSLNIKATLEDTEELFQMIVENSKDAFIYYTLQPEPVMSYVTPSMGDITGYPSLDFIKNPRLLLEIMSGEDVALLRRMIQEHDYSHLPFTEVVKITCKDGSRKFIELSCSVIRKDGHPIAIEGAFSDVTQIEETRDKLVESKKSKDLMLSYVSHELKTPVTSVLGFATALKDGTYTTEKQQSHALDVIIEKSKFLRRMIDDLSQLSKMETNQYSFTYELLSCNELASTIKKTTISELENSGIKHKYLLDYRNMTGHEVVADSVRICQVATNLINNAIRHTRPKNIITVKCELDKNEQNMVISVSDRGAGIKSEDMASVFNRFYQGQQRGAKDGRGLGLAIAKEIVEAHGGEISAKSSYGAGSSFLFTIPLYK